MTKPGSCGRTRKASLPSESPIAPPGNPAGRILPRYPPRERLSPPYRTVSFCNLSFSKSSQHELLRRLEIQENPSSSSPLDRDGAALSCSSLPLVPQIAYTWRRLCFLIETEL
jgi:hypothetical protein